MRAFKKYQIEEQLLKQESLVTTNTFRVDEEYTNPIEDINLLNDLEETIQNQSFDVIIFQDYNKGLYRITYSQSY